GVCVYVCIYVAGSTSSPCATCAAVPKPASRDIPTNIRSPTRPAASRAANSGQDYFRIRSGPAAKAGPSEWHKRGVASGALRPGDARSGGRSRRRRRTNTTRRKE
ncbi:unnamed protein product, partial [Prorocentrum cordatum]